MGLGAPGLAGGLRPLLALRPLSPGCPGRAAG